MKAQTNGIGTYYELHGKEGLPWLVLSHSLACSVRMWDPQIEALKGDYRILAYDTRGHGGTEAPKGAYTLELLADDLFFLLKELKISQAHYCGLSMGGMIGQTFALKYPAMFASLTLADTTSRMPAEALPAWQDRIRTAESQGMQPLVEPTLARWFTEPFRKAEPQTMQRIGTLIGSTPVAGYVGCCQAIPQINLTSRLKEIRSPILVIVGEDDPGTPVAMSKEIHENASGSKLVVLPRAAHLSNIEQSGGFNRALGEFLKAH